MQNDGYFIGTGKQGDYVTDQELQDGLGTKTDIGHNHEIGDITNLANTLSQKLTANQAMAQADSVASDITGLVTDFNALLSKLRAAGILSE